MGKKGDLSDYGMNVGVRQAGLSFFSETADLLRFTETETPQSSDLNPIENFWDVMERKIPITDEAEKNFSNSVMLSAQYGPKPQRNVSNTLFNLKGFNLVLARWT